MTASHIGHRLTEAHRLAQAQVGAQTAALVARTFRLLDPNDIEATFEPWLSVASPVIQAQRAKSAVLAGAYLDAFRSVEIDGTFRSVIAGAAPEAQIATSMLVTGPVALRDRLTRMTEHAAVDMTMAGAAAAAMRLALGAGRDTITQTIQADHRARGYERVTSGTACDFCEMLADRGEVYGEESADFEAHDHCSCSAEPVYE